MKVFYRQVAKDDVIRQFRYYLITLNLPEIALRFRDSVRRTVQELRRYPHVGSIYPSNNPRLQSLRSWPVMGFESIRIYYLFDQDAIQVVRVLHGKRNVRHILAHEEEL